MAKKTETPVIETKPPDPPPHLSTKMKAFWITVHTCKKLRPDETLVLSRACEAFDRGEQARRILKREGLTYEDRFHQPRSRPEVAIERDSRAQFAKLLRQINLYAVEPWYT